MILSEANIRSINDDDWYIIKLDTTSTGEKQLIVLKHFSPSYRWSAQSDNPGTLAARGMQLKSAYYAMFS
jgi:hypothetical protein